MARRSKNEDPELNEEDGGPPGGAPKRHRSHPHLVQAFLDDRQMERLKQVQQDAFDQTGFRSYLSVIARRLLEEAIAVRLGEK